MIRRTVSWTTSVTIGVFPGACAWCEEPTPEPSDDEVLDLVRTRPGQNFMHPSDWIPESWERHGGDLLCPGCLLALDQARESRRRP